MLTTKSTKLIFGITSSHPDVFYMPNVTIIEFYLPSVIITSIWQVGECECCGLPLNCNFGLYFTSHLPAHMFTRYKLDSHNRMSISKQTPHNSDVTFVNSVSGLSLCCHGDWHATFFDIIQFRFNSKQFIAKKIQQIHSVHCKQFIFKAIGTGHLLVYVSHNYMHTAISFIKVWKRCRPLDILVENTSIVSNGKLWNRSSLNW